MMRSIHKKIDKFMLNMITKSFAPSRIVQLPHLSQLIRFAPPVTIDKKFSVKLHRLETCRWHFPTKLRNYCGWPNMASWKSILVKVHFHLRLTAGLILPRSLRNDRETILLLMQVCLSNTLFSATHLILL